MARRYVITTPANHDLEDILRDIADFAGFDQSDRFLTRFTEKLENIVAFPNLGKPRLEWGENYECRNRFASDATCIKRGQDLF